MNKKIAVVTGASRGIGKAIAVDLAAQHYHVVLVSKTEKRLQKLQAEIQGSGFDASYYAFDVSNVSEIKKCIDDVVNQFGRIDVLFNNAGVLHIGTSDIEDSKLDEILNVNLRAAIYFAKYVAAQMKKQKSGYIFNVSSASGKRALPIVGAYAASKFGLVGFNEALFKELMPYNVKTSVICPSFVATDMVSGFDFDPALMISPGDIVQTVNYLLSLSDTAAVQEVMVSCVATVAHETAATIARVEGRRGHPGQRT